MVSDVLNYLVFGLVSLGIDIYMLVRLRETLNEKLTRIKNMKQTNKEANRNANSNKNAKKEQSTEQNIKNSMNNAIRMVVINSLLNIGLKLPYCYASLINLTINISEKFYKNTKATQRFQLFYCRLCRGFFISFMPEPGDFLFIILISIQLFIYIRFDLKIKAGFKRILNKSDQ